MCKDHKYFTWFCIYIKERQKLTAALDIRKGLTSCLPSGHVMCSSQDRECSFAAFLVSKQWLLLTTEQRAFSYSMETMYLLLEKKDRCQIKNQKVQRRQQKLLF